MTEPSHFGGALDLGVPCEYVLLRQIHVAAVILGHEEEPFIVCHQRLRLVVHTPIHVLNFKTCKISKIFKNLNLQSSQSWRRRTVLVRIAK